MSEQDRWLLPEGVEELLPDDARRIETMRRRVLDLFSSWGYELVMPPMIEFLESLLTGVGEDMDLQTFKITDQVSGRLMGIRPDITPQVARIDSHYLKREAPARLCYLGPVLRTRTDQYPGSREPLQFGAELFGHSGCESDAEVLSLMITTLETLGIKGAHIELGHVGIFSAMVEKAVLNEKQQKILFDQLQRKAKPEMIAVFKQWDLAKKWEEGFLALVELCGDSSVLDTAEEQLSKLDNGVRKTLQQLRAVSERLQKRRPELTINYDLAELSGYHYYTGVVFSAFLPGHGRAVAKGGRYDGIGQAFGRARAATGFGADLKELLGFLKKETNLQTGILAPSDNDKSLIKTISDLRASGESVVMDLPGAQAEASALGCNRKLVKEKNAWIVKEI